MNLLVIAVVAFVVAVLATPFAIVTARRTGIMDRPGDLKPQDRAVPYLGGTAVLAGMVVGALSGRPSVLIPLVAATALGVTDDRFDLSPLVRLAGQLVIGLTVVVVCPVRFSGLTATVLVIVLTVVMINGMNLLDGLDMLATGVAAAAAVGFAVLTHGWGRQLAVALAAAAVGFLLYNRPPARIYLGDGGSYLLGTALVTLLAAAWAHGVPTTRGVASLVLVVIPGVEIFCALVRRGRARRSLMAGDRGHPYDRLVASGWPRPAASLAYIGLEGLLAVGAIAAGLGSSVPAAIGVDVFGAALVLGSATATGALAPEDAPT